MNGALNANNHLIIRKRFLKKKKLMFPGHCFTNFQDNQDSIKAT